MNDIKPVAWWSKGDSWEFISGAEKPPEDFGPCVALYTEAQLRAAKVQVLRQAIDEIDPTWEGLEVLRRIADELETGK